MKIVGLNWFDSDGGIVRVEMIRVEDSDYRNIILYRDGCSLEPNGDFAEYVEISMKYFVKNRDDVVASFLSDYGDRICPNMLLGLNDF